MNRLMPPPERDLPDQVHREIHTNLLRASRTPTRHRRRGLVVVPALVLTGVIGAAAVELGLPGDHGPVTGVPAPAGPVATSAIPARTPTLSAIPAAQPIDRGPLSNAVIDTIVKDCLSGSPGGGTVAQVHLARQTSIVGPVVLLTDNVGIQHACQVGSDIVKPPLDASSPSGDLVGPIPTEEQPVVELTGPSTEGSGPAKGTTEPLRFASLNYYRVGPDVASVQLRISVDGHTGPWFEASIADGYAAAAASIGFSSPARDEMPDLRVEDRAFDHAGHELDINHATR